MEITNIDKNKNVWNEIANDSYVIQINEMEMKIFRKLSIKQEYDALIKFLDSFGRKELIQEAKEKYSKHL